VGEDILFPLRLLKSGIFEIKQQLETNVPQESGTAFGFSD
jgi:hypothetical protein